jgi:hypothetical protein
MKEIEWLQVATNVDIALGRVLDAGDHPILAFSQEVCPVGAPTSICGFSGGLYREIDGTYIRTAAQAANKDGPIVRKIPVLNVGEVRPFAAKSFPAIITRPAGVGGMSGAPLLDGHGTVIGVHSNNNIDPIVTLFGDPVAVSVEAFIPAEMLIAHLKAQVQALEEEAAAKRT